MSPGPRDVAVSFLLASLNPESVTSTESSAATGRGNEIAESDELADHHIKSSHHVKNMHIDADYTCMSLAFTGDAALRKFRGVFRAPKRTPLSTPLTLWTGELQRVRAACAVVAIADQREATIQAEFS